MANMKYLIHSECAKHDVSSVTVESLIARLLVARAVYHHYKNMPPEVGDAYYLLAMQVLVSGSRQRLSAITHNRAIGMLSRLLTKEAVLAWLDAVC